MLKKSFATALLATIGFTAQAAEGIKTYNFAPNTLSPKGAELTLDMAKGEITTTSKPGKISCNDFAFGAILVDSMQGEALAKAIKTPQQQTQLTTYFDTMAQILDDCQESNGALSAEMHKDAKEGLGDIKKRISSLRLTQ